MNMTPQHLEFAHLVDLVEGCQPDDVRAASLAHVAACSDCAGQLSSLERVIGAMRADMTEDAPQATIARALNIFRTRAAFGMSAKPSLVRRVRAALSFDSMDLMPAFGVRSGQQTTRQLLFSAGEQELDLRVAPSGEKWVVSGQLLGTECMDGRVELEGAAASAEATLNELCEFMLPSVPSGNYKLRLHLSDMEVEVPELELKA